MATMQVNFVSDSLMRAVTVNVILPIDKMGFPGMPGPKIPDKFKTLYLLHGILGDHEDWITGTRIKRWAMDNNLAVVMPAGENGFYIDSRVDTNKFGQFIGKELVEMTRKMFPLSDKREDTFIAGLSMGGYGALVNGLKYSDTFSYIGALSSALVIDEAVNSVEDTPIPFQKRSYYERQFGDLSKLYGSDADCKYLVKELKKKDKDIPYIYMAVGEDDGLRKVNEEFRDFLINEGVDVDFNMGPGNHEWDFWDKYIYKFIKVLPLDEGDKGIDSGNVGI